MHIEIIASLHTSSCINAMRQFFAIYGPARQIRSDCETNLLAAAKELGLSNKDHDVTMQRFLSELNCLWMFNPLMHPILEGLGINSWVWQSGS